MSVAQITQQQQVAKQAFERGEISKSQYTEFMIYSNAQKQQAVNAQNKAASTPSAPLGNAPPVQGNWQPAEQPKIDAETYAKAMNLLKAGGQVTPSPPSTSTPTSNVPAPLPSQLGTAPPPTKTEVEINWQKVTPETPKTPEMEQNLAVGESTTFWISKGYPEYAGKYAPVEVPPGQEIYQIKEVEHGPLVYGTDYGTKDNPNPPPSQSLEVVIGPKIMWVEEENQGSFFGPTQPARLATEAERNELKQRYLAGGNIYGMFPEEKAVAGLTLATGVVLPIATAPTALAAGQIIAGQAAAIGIGEVVTGGALTPVEAVGLAAVGGFGVQAGRSAYFKFVDPRAKAYIQERVNESYEMQMRLNEAFLSDKPLPENLPSNAEVRAWKGWQPSTMKEKAAAFLNRQDTFTPTNTFAPQTNVARVPAGPDTGRQIGYSDVARVKSAEDLFDFGFVPKSSMKTINLPVNTAKSAVSSIAPSSARLPTFNFSSLMAEFKSDLRTAEINELLKQNKVDSGVNAKYPEDIRSKNYGQLAFERPRLEYAEGKTIGYEWSMPYQGEPTSNVGTKPFIDYSKTQPKTGGTPISEGNVKTVVESPTKNVVDITPVPNTPVVTVQPKVANPFTQFPGTPYYRQQVKEEEELTQIVYPINTPLQTPPMLSNIAANTRTKEERKAVPIATPNLSVNYPQITPVKPITAPKTYLEPQVPKVAPDFLAIQKPKQEPTPAQFPVTIQTPIEIPKPIQEQPVPVVPIFDIPEPTQPPPEIPPTFNFPTPRAPSFPLGAKALGGGPSMFPDIKFTGVKSKKREYPIFTAYEVVKGRKWTSPSKKRTRRE